MYIADRLQELKLNTVQLQLQGSTLIVTINRPAALNALSREVIAELRAVFDLLRQLGSAADRQAAAVSTAGRDWSVRGVVLTGAGEKSFVAGADIAQMQQMTPAEANTYAADAQELTLWFAQLPVPVIAAVNGYALGGGCEIALACDYVYAAENAVFGQPEVGLGLIPGFGGTVRLFRQAGPAIARELIYSGRRITASEAAQAGLVNQVFATPAETVAAAVKSVELISKQSPCAVAKAKAVMDEVENLSVAAGLEHEKAVFAGIFQTPEMIEGTSAFLEKRQADFQNGN